MFPATLEACRPTFSICSTEPFKTKVKDSDSTEKPSIDRRLKRRELPSNAANKKKMGAERNPIVEGDARELGAVAECYPGEEGITVQGARDISKAFEPRVQQCFDSRQSGHVNARLIMLIEYAANNPSKMRIQKYDEWVFEAFLKDKDAERKAASLNRVHQQRELAMVKQELNMQSWWSALVEKIGIGTVAIRVRDRDSLLRPADRCIVGRNPANDTAISLAQSQ